MPPPAESLELATLDAKSNTLPSHCAPHIMGMIRNFQSNGTALQGTALSRFLLDIIYASRLNFATYHIYTKASLQCSC